MNNEQAAPVTTPKKPSLALNFLLILIGMAIIAGVAVLAFRLGQSQPTPLKETLPTPTLEPTLTPELTIEPTGTTGTPTGKPKSDLEKIKEAFAEKYDKDLDEVNVSISENTGTHSRGGISFSGEMGGGMWLAYKDGDDWKIVHDGQGTIPCENVDPYDFPVSMVSECWNEATGKLVTRE